MTQAPIHPRTLNMSAGRTATIKFNQGHTLLILAKQYPSLLEVILEATQNALDTDARAKRIWITVNFKTRHLAVRDNGDGVSVEKFNNALASVATPGRKGEGSLGEFGLGLISPIGKCNYFTFTSCPRPYNNGFREWSFNTDHIVKETEVLTVPFRDRPDLTLEAPAPRGKTCVPWRSELSLIGFTSDNYTSKITMDSLVGSILDRFSTTMRKLGTVLSVEITDENGKVERRPSVTAADFEGRALPEQTFEITPGSGKTHFRLFVAPRRAKGRKGSVLVGIHGSDFKFPFRFISRSATEFLGDAVTSALLSGFFEGEITSEKCTLHEGRKAFNHDDAFVSFCCALEEWYEKFGKDCLGELQNVREEQRFQELGLRSMDVIKQLLSAPEHEQLMEVIRSFGRGTVGAGHTPLSSNRVVGEQDHTALSVDNQSDDSSKSQDAGPRVRNEPKKEIVPHMPFTVAGPSGQVRKVVRGSSFGLQFAHEAMEGSPDLWKIDTVNGILTFNIRHPLWKACDVRDTTLMRLQEHVAMQALTLMSFDEHLRVSQRLAFDAYNHVFVTWILNSDKARGTVSGKKPSTPRARKG